MKAPPPTSSYLSRLVDSRGRLVVAWLRPSAATVRPVYVAGLAPEVW